MAATEPPEGPQDARPTSPDNRAEEFGAPKLAKIGIRDADGDVETPWAFHLGGNFYRLDNIPFFAYGLSVNDIVEAVPDSDGFPMFNRIVNKSGNRTVRVILPEAPDVEPGPALFAEVKRLGCDYEGAFNTLICINVPPAVLLQDVADCLTRLGVRWEYADPKYEDLFPDDQ